ncbi:MAG: Gfo/Idh/MocA family protein [Dehalococcoidia bacterium]
MANDRKIRIGVIGAGGHSKRRVLPELNEIPEVELVAVANRSKESTDEVAKTFGFDRAEEDWKAIVNSEDIDLIYNGTQAPEHHAIILDAISNNKHVFTLNPLAMTSQQGEEIVKALQQNPEVKFKQYPSFAQHPYAREDEIVLDLLKSNRLGRILTANVTWHTPYLALASYQEVMHRWVGNHKRVLGYRKQYEIGGETVHGRPVKRGLTSVIAELENDISVTYTHNTVVSELLRKPKVEIHGEDASLVVYAGQLNYASQDEGELNHEDPSIFISNASTGQMEPVEIPNHLKDSWNDPRGVLVEKQFIEWLLAGVTPSPILLDAVIALKSLDFAEGFVASMRQENTWIDLPDRS